MKLEDLVEYKTSKTVRGLNDLDSNKITFVMHKNGVLQFRKNKIGSFLVDADEEHLKYLPEVETGFKFALPKVPGEILGTIISFFKRVVKEKKGAEAMVQIFWNDIKRSYFIHCCDQNVSGASVKFKRNVDLEKKYILVADIHSHNSMDAFFSGTDDGDEKEDRIYGVIGKLNTNSVKILLRAGCGGNYVDLKPESIFEFMPTRSYEFPISWMRKVKHAPPISRHANLDKMFGFGNGFEGVKIYRDDNDNRCPFCGRFMKKKKEDYYGY